MSLYCRSVSDEDKKLYNLETCSVTSLDWLPNSDRHFVYGTSNGTIRLCDAEDRKVVTETSASKDASPTISIQQVDHFILSLRSGNP
jgi:hypothetical protein